MAEKGKLTRLMLIINPSAGNSTNAKDHLKSVRRYLEANGFEVSVEKARPKSLATPLASQAAKDGWDVVAVMGGDGTVQAAMRGLTGSKTRLAILPTGGQNTIARSLGIPLDLEAACRMIVAGHIHPMDVGQVKVGKEPWQPFFEIVGVGAVSALETEPEASSKLEDELFRSQIAVSAEENGPRAIINLDHDRIVEVDTRLITVSSMTLFGKKLFVPVPDSLQDGQLDVSIFQSFSEGELQGYYSKVKGGYFSGSSNIEHYPARMIKIRTSPRMEVSVDGKVQGRGTVSVRMCPGALQMIAAHESRDMLGLPRGAYETAAASASFASEIHSGSSG